MSNLNKTWLIDIDGSIVKHNGHKIDGFDSFLPNAREFLISIPKNDCIIFLTARNKNEIKIFKKFLKAHKIRFDFIIPNLPFGERILINDIKPSGLKTAIAINKKRDYKMELEIESKI